MKHSWPEGEGKCQNQGCKSRRRGGMTAAWTYDKNDMDWRRSPGPCNGEPTPKFERKLTHRWQQLGGQCRRMGCPWARVGLTGSGLWVLRHIVTGKEWDGERIPSCEGKT